MGNKRNNNNNNNVKSALTDVNLISSSQELLNDSASLNYSNAIGLDYHLKPDAIKTGIQYYSTEADLNSPGVLVLRTMLTPGICTQTTDVMTMASRDLYAYVRSRNSGAKNYDAPDMMLAIYAIDSAYALLEHLRRAYGIANNFSISNRYLPYRILEGMNFNPNDVVSHRRQLKTVIDMLAAKLNAYSVPKEWPIFQRHMGMFSEIYKDSMSPKAQIAFFTPSGYYRYVETQGPGRLDYVRIEVNDHFTVAEWEQIANGIIEPLNASEDISIIMGDLEKTFDASNCWVAVGVNEDYSVWPVYDEGVLMEIHNATILNSGLSNTSISQNVSGALQFNPTFTSQYWGLQYEPILNLNKATPTPADNLLGTSFMVHCKLTNTSVPEPTQREYAIVSCGTEIIEEAYIYYRAANSIAKVVTNLSFESTLQPAQIWASLRTLAWLSRFDWAPQIRMWFRVKVDDAAEGYHFHTFFDQDQYTPLNWSTLDRIHDARVFSAFNIPARG